MSQLNHTAGFSLVWSVGLVAVLAAILGNRAIAEVVGGGVVVFAAFQLGRPLTRQVVIEVDPRRELLWNVLLVLVIVLALVGVGIMGAAISESP